MSVLFEATEINGMKLPNRFVRSATWEGMATEDGAVTPKLQQTLVDLAQGSVGLIIPGHAYVVPEGKATPLQLGIYSDALIDGLKNMTDAVHQAGGTLVAQLAHAGHFTEEGVCGHTPHVVSNYEGLSDAPRHEMTTEDISGLVRAFAQAAVRAKKAGFDGVQIHGAHGYLLSQFLSPAFNRRPDEYGGSLENRARALMEVYGAIRAAVGDDFPVLVKINSEDCLENGLTREDSLAVCVMLAKAGMDAIELSGGTLISRKLSPSRPGITESAKEAYFKDAAAALKKAVDVPLILVGGMRSPEVAEKAIAEGVADYVSMARPFIREPGLIKRWQSGDTRPATCKSDNQCFKSAMQGQGISCALNK